MVKQQGVNILPIDINKSENEFTADPSQNAIYFGLDGVKGLRGEVKQNLISARPFDGMKDFIERVKPDVSSLTALMKSGAFSEDNQEEIFADYHANYSKQINGQNFLFLSRNGLWPDEFEEEKRLFNFTQYLKSITDKEDKESQLYAIDEKAKKYLDSINYYYGDDYIDQIEWKKYYDETLAPFKEYLQLEQEDILQKVNNFKKQELLSKYFNSTKAIGEIETLGLTFQEHPMNAVQNVSNFTDLAEEPEIATLYQIKGKTIPLWRLTLIPGFIIAVDKLHYSATVLARDCTFDIKFTKESYAHYAAQISRKNPDGTKTVIEKPWLRRGTMVLLQGYRRGDQFVLKKYKNSKFQHTIVKITNITSDGMLSIQKERISGNEENAEDE